MKRRSLAVLSLSMTTFGISCGPTARPAVERQPSLLEGFDQPPIYKAETFWTEIGKLVARQHYWRASLLLDEADPEKQAYFDLEHRCAMAVGVVGYALWFPGIENHNPFREVDYRTMPGTSDFYVNAGHWAWNAEARFWAERYNQTLITRSDPHRLLSDGTYTAQQYQAAISGRDPTTLPFPNGD